AVRRLLSISAGEKSMSERDVINHREWENLTPGTSSCARPKTPGNMVTTDATMPYTQTKLF
ncbi:MAG TPA: hypothetical protein VJ691_18500, partial [Vicinamibacterales bacterium]|nr:hypothetical protein [Vicinamibacterales bacterium]